MEPKRLIIGQLQASKSWLEIFTSELSTCSELSEARLPGQSETLNWIFGHLAVNEDWFLQQLTGSELTLPQDWRDLYFLDDSPSHVTIDNQVPFADLLKAFDEVRLRVYKAVENANENSWLGPPPESLQDYFETRGDVWGGLATHPFWHVGHAATIHQMLGKKFPQP